jgi:competence protein ComFC
MKCILCERLSFSHICTPCQEKFLTPSLYKREINSTQVYTFYKYSEIKDLLYTKHSDIGFYIYRLLAQKSFAAFARSFELGKGETFASIAIDDVPKSGYSHTAILNEALQSQHIRVHHNRLRDESGVSYAGKSKAFRLLNPRKFSLKPFAQKEVILVDDIITTGLTFSAAIKKMQKEGKEVAFCLALADVQLDTKKDIK